MATTAPRVRWKDPWLWAALAATVLSLGLGHALKEPGLDANWLRYTDIRHLYHDPGPLAHEGLDRGIDEERLPYVEAFNEYPVLTGLWMHGAALLADDEDAFFRINAIGLSLVALATTVALWRVAEDRRRVLWWGLAPSLVLYAFHNWDLLAILLAVLGLLAHRRNRPLEAGILLALGASAKIWPALLLPMVGLEVLRREVASRPRRPWSWHPRTWPLGPASWRFGLGAVGALAAVNVPFLLANTRLFLATYRFHGDRGPTAESFWSVARLYAARWELAWVQRLVSEEVLPTLSRVLLLAGLVALGWGVWRRHLTGVEASFGALLVFLVTNQVFSVQYALWVVPFVVLLRVPWERIVLFFVADGATYLAIFRYFNHAGTPQLFDWYDWVGFASTLRHVALLILLGWVVMAGVRRRAAGVEASGQAEEAGPARDPGAERGPEDAARTT